MVHVRDQKQLDMRKLLVSPDAPLPSVLVSVFPSPTSLTAPPHLLSLSVNKHLLRESSSRPHLPVSNLALVLFILILTLYQIYHK